MAAKLEWANESPGGAGLMLGVWMLAEVYRIGGHRGGKRAFKYSLNATAPDGHPYESLDDAKRDAESEVRRLLKAAGVEVS